MKNLQSTTEGVWIELKSVTLTEEQIDLMSSTKEDDQDAKIELSQLIKSQREVSAQEEDILIAQTKYNEVKSTLEETDVYQLISFNFFDNEGILNCRVNGEHKQIRF